MNVQRMTGLVWRRLDKVRKDPVEEHASCVGPRGLRAQCIDNFRRAINSEPVNWTSAIEMGIRRGKPVSRHRDVSPNEQRMCQDILQVHEHSRLTRPRNALAGDPPARLGRRNLEQVSSSSGTAHSFHNEPGSLLGLPAAAIVRRRRGVGRLLPATRRGGRLLGRRCRTRGPRRSPARRRPFRNEPTRASALRLGRLRDGSLARRAVPVGGHKDSLARNETVAPSIYVVRRRMLRPRAIGPPGYGTTRM